jgi:hypothetical protein
MKGMDAQEYANRLGLYLRKEPDGTVYGYPKIPVITRHGWDSVDNVYYKVPPSVIFPEGLWETTIIDPRPDASELKEGQPIIVWMKGMAEKCRYFSHLGDRAGIVHTYADGATKWSGDGKTTPWCNWRWPTEEELDVDKK